MVDEGGVVRVTTATKAVSEAARDLASSDAVIAQHIAAEHARQRNSIELIASENIASRAVLEAQGSVLTNKYAEGYPGRRYYAGCIHVDAIETLAIERARTLFDCAYANVQAHSGSQANEAVFLALLKPGDTVLGMSLIAGGHLTHGAAVNISGKLFNALAYGLRADDHRIDMEQVSALARQHRPKLIIAGGSAYSRIIDFRAFRRIADEVGAFLLVDMAHFAGLVAGGVYPSPLPEAHVVTATTHKTLRGPRGGIILANDKDLGKKIDAAIFPGLQGGPLMHVVAAKAVALGEALAPSFRGYAAAVVANAQALAGALAKGGLNIVSGGTDTHLAVVDLRPLGVTGSVAEHALEQVGITLNKNMIPNDPQRPLVTSGIRVGSPAGTSRGFGRDDFEEIAQMMLRMLTQLSERSNAVDANVAAEIRQQVVQLCQKYPLPY